MRSSILILIFATLLACASTFAQNGPSEPRPVLVDVIGSRGKTVRSARANLAPTVNAGYGSANATEMRAFQLMNAQRQAMGLPMLPWDEQIVELARIHSRNMAENKFFSHKDINGGFVDDRASKLGIFNWMAIGENIAFMKGYDDPAVTAVEKWMQSPSHKKNILNDQWRESAIGVAVAADGAVYFTQVFITR